MTLGTGPQPPAQPAWAVPPPPPIRWEQTEPLEYHQLFRGAPRYRWFKPLLALVLATLYYLTLQVMFLLVVMGLYALFGGGFSLEMLDDLIVPDTQKPWSILSTLGSIALMIPAVWLAMISTGLTPFGRGWSVALRIRWRWIWRTALQSIVVLIVMNGIGIALQMVLPEDPAASAAAEQAPRIDVTLALWSLALVLLLVPVQATAEELVYRGLFMQTLGAWLGGVRARGVVGSLLRGPWIPILLPALLFGFSHIYDVWGFWTVTAMAVAAGWLSWRTGGLEAAISLHVVNNLVAFGFMAFAFGGQTAQTETSGGPGMLIGEVVGLALFCWWVDRDFSRLDGRRTRIDLVQSRRPAPPAPAAVAAAGPAAHGEHGSDGSAAPADPTPRNDA